MSIPTTNRIRRALPDQTVAWVDWPAGADVGAVLAEHGGADVVMALGNVPPAHELVQPETAHGWRLASAWLGNEGRPVVRYWTPDGRRRVTVMAGASWVEQGTDAGAAQWAWRRFCAEMRAEYGCRPLPTPAATGRELWRRHIPDDGWPVLETGYQDLIRSTSGQGRVQYFPAGPVEGHRLVDLDMRLAYGALADRLPVGPADLRSGPPDDVGAWCHGSHRALVRWQAPPDWQHLGILPAKDDGGGWQWPSRGSGWVGSAEVAVALVHGWRVSFIERLDFLGTGDPLGPWARKLVRLRQREVKADRPLVAGMWRRTLIDAIGAFHGRPHKVTATAHAEAVIPDQATGVRFIGDDRLAWEQVEESAATTDMAHPEWSAAIWSRTRARVLDSPAPERRRVGALYCRPETIAAILTDALVLTVDPGWPDDGRAGRFRVKGAVTVDTMPTTARDLLAARRG